MQNKTLEKAVNLYATEGHINLNTYLLGLSKDSLISCFNDLLTIYFNDVNSSTLREIVTVTLAGFTHNVGKIGFNGYRQIATGKVENCEAKPKNVSSEQFELYKCGKRSSKPAPLNGGGNITDYTWARFNKDTKENPTFLSSGFVDGRLLYIIKFNFKSFDLQENFKRLLTKHFPDGDVPGSFLRSATFDFRHYIKDGNTKIVYKIGIDELIEYEKFFHRDFLKYLKGA